MGIFLAFTFSILDLAKGLCIPAGCEGADGLPVPELDILLKVYFLGKKKKQKNRV